MRGRRRPLFLIIDSLPAYKAKVVLDYVEATGGKLKLFFLRGYARELNPDELVWSHMKRNGTAKRPLASNESLRVGRTTPTLSMRKIASRNNWKRVLDACGPPCARHTGSTDQSA